MPPSVGVTENRRNVSETVASKMHPCSRTAGMSAANAARDGRCTYKTPDAKSWPSAVKRRVLTALGHDLGIDLHLVLSGLGKVRKVLWNWCVLVERHVGGVLHESRRNLLTTCIES